MRVVKAGNEVSSFIGVTKTEDTSLAQPPNTILVKRREALQHKFEESIQYLNEAGKRHRAFDIYRNLTIAYAQLWRHEEAVKAMNEGYAIDKSIVKDRESMHAAAVSYIFLGKLHFAVGFLKMLIQADPQAANDPEIHKTMAYMSKKLEEQKK